LENVADVRSQRTMRAWSGASDWCVPCGRRPGYSKCLHSRFTHGSVMPGDSSWPTACHRCW